MCVNPTKVSQFFMRLEMANLENEDGSILLV